MTCLLPNRRFLSETSGMREFAGPAAPADAILGVARAA